jgi:hypothetical protein
LLISILISVLLVLSLSNTDGPENQGAKSEPQGDPLQCATLKTMLSTGRVVQWHVDTQGPSVINP